MAWNLFCDPRVDVLGQRGAFLSHDFGLPRTGSSSVVHSSSLDSLHSSPGTSSSSAWALGLRWNGPKPLGPSGPTHTHTHTYIYIYISFMIITTINCNLLQFNLYRIVHCYNITLYINCYINCYI